MEKEIKNKFFIFFSTLFILIVLFSNVSSGDVVISNSDPNISNIKLKDNGNSYNLTFEVQDDNGWQDIFLLNVSLCEDGDVVRKFTFKQNASWGVNYSSSEDVDYEFITSKGTDFKKSNVTYFKGNMVEKKTTFSVKVVFSKGDYSKLKVDAYDKHKGESEFSIALKDIDNGAGFTPYFFFLSLPLVAAVSYRFFVNTEGVKYYEK